MPKANSSGTISRRATLRSFAATASLALFKAPARPDYGQSKPGQVPLPLPDWLQQTNAGVAMMCAGFIAEFRAYQARGGELDEDSLDEVIDRREQLLARIAASPARNVDDLRAKAAAMLEYASVMIPEPQMDFGHHLAASIARDLVSIA